jgi:hypothetical protein
MFYIDSSLNLRMLKDNLECLIKQYIEKEQSVCTKFNLHWKKKQFTILK